jgi:hypothetical protein
VDPSAPATDVWRRRWSRRLLALDVDLDVDLGAVGGTLDELLRQLVLSGTTSAQDKG